MFLKKLEPISENSMDERWKWVKVQVGKFHQNYFYFNICNKLITFSNNSLGLGLFGCIK